LIHRIAHTDIPSSIGLNWLAFEDRRTVTQNLAGPHLAAT
jgi:hypothetical protein